MVVVGATRGRSGGGGGGGVGGGGAGSVEDGKVCSVAWQRQHQHHQQHNSKASLKHAALGGETLPVVELKPFTRKVWRREKSLPNFYEKPVPQKEDSGAESSRPARNGPPPDIVRYIRELSDQQKTVDTRQSADSTLRYRSKLHPKTDFSFEGWSVAEHQQDIIPSFISRQDRTKTALAEDGVGSAAAAAAGAGSAGNGGGAENVSDRSTGQGAGQGPGAAPGAGSLGREVSNLMAAYTRDKPLQQQQVCLTGDKLSMANLGKRQLTYLNPFSAYRQKQPWNVLRPENTPASFSPRRHIGLSAAGRGGAGGGAGGETGAALFLSANGHLARRDLVLSGSSFHHTDRVPLQPLRAPHSSSPHKFNSKLGAAHDSLFLLSRTGAPTVLEKNLSFDQEVRLERCRRERSFAAVSETNVLATAHYVAYENQPTRGEINLMRAREANKSRDGAKVALKRNGFHKPMGMLPPFGHGHPHFLGPVPDDSPRSVRSDIGDSGILSSPGESKDATARTWDVTARTDEVTGRPGDVTVGPGNNPQEEAIPEHPGESEEQDESRAGDRQGADMGVWAQKDNMLVLPGETVGDLAESTDEYRRPLSDTAATEAVHIRNELTPMSAENRARLLPRDDSYLGSGNSERGHTSQRQYREGFVADVQPSADTVQSSEDQALTTATSGAETTTKTALTSSDKQTASLTYEQHPGHTESRHNTVVKQRGDVSQPVSLAKQEESVADNVNASQSTAPVDTVFQVIRSNSGAGKKTGTDPPRHTAVSQDTKVDNPQSDELNDLQLLSVNFSAASLSNLNSARGPSETAPPELSSGSPGRAGPGNGHTEMKTNSSVSDVATKETSTSSQKDGNQEDSETKENTKQATAPGDSAGQDAQADHGSHAEDPSQREQRVPAGPQEDRKLSPAGKEQISRSESQQLDVLDSERNVSKTVAPDGDSSSDDSSVSSTKHDDKGIYGVGTIAPPSASSTSSSRSSESGLNAPEVKSSETKPSDTKLPEVAPPQEEKTEGSLAVYGEGDPSAPSADVRQDSAQQTVHSQEESKGVETIVTVTMDKTQSGDNFDGSKTFLTTTNVESEEWQNMVKV